MNDTDELLSPQLSPFASQLYQDARDKNVTIKQTEAQKLELEQKVIADISALIHKETLSPPDSVRISEFPSHDVVLTRLAVFWLAEETHGVKGVGDFKCGESDRKFGTKEELARYIHELLERERTSVEPLDILERTAFDHLGENAFKVRTREERGIWQRTCPRCDGKRIETCPGCDGAKRFQCDACNGKGQFDCSTCNGEGKVPCFSCGGFGSNSCGWCGGTGEMYSESEGRYVSCSACGGGRSCRRCNGTGKVDCSTCWGSGKVPCRSCRGRGWVKCSTCNGVGTVPCRRCAATGVLHELVFVESVARKREITFCKDFLPDVPLPVMTLAGIFRDDGSREVALYAECRVVICTFTVIGPKGEQIPLTVWGERHGLTCSSLDLI